MIITFFQYLQKLHIHLFINSLVFLFIRHFINDFKIFHKCYNHENVTFFKKK